MFLAFIFNEVLKHEKSYFISLVILNHCDLLPPIDSYMVRDPRGGEYKVPTKGTFVFSLKSSIK